AASQAGHAPPAGSSPPAWGNVPDRNAGSRKPPACVTEPLNELNMSTAAASRYDTQDITVLEGLEPVRKRPSMYIGGVDSKGLHHLVWEIVDNAVDEYLNGYADSVHVVLHKNGDAVTVTDNGRGIPVDLHPKYKRPALE